MNLTRVAAKQLTASDLTFFAVHFRRTGQRSKQKAINLNADVFVSQFYPGLRDRFADLHFGLTIVGPSAAPPYVLSRKAVRTEGAKNWRLDGEIINDPADEAGRFDVLVQNDIAILAFEGSEQPEHVTIVLLSATVDAALHTEVSRLAGFRGRETMQPITENELRVLLERTRSNYSGTHPFESLLTADSIEEAIYGPLESQETTARTDGRGAAISPESIRRQALNAGATGQLGEEAFERWLIDSGHVATDFEWVSLTHGRAAFDFEISKPQWEQVVGALHVDVKSTRGAHDSTLHMSAAELRWAADHPGYRIARISALTARSAEVRILGNVTAVAETILSGLRSSLPNGVKLDSLEIPASLFIEIHARRVEWSAED